MIWAIIRMVLTRVSVVPTDANLILAEILLELHIL
jgi:hypothetical protein